MSAAISENSCVDLAERAGRYLTFALGGASYGISAANVREIIRMIDITPVPHMPRCVKGVINLRGKVVPIIDLRLRFDLATTQSVERVCIIIVQSATRARTGNLMGLMVDAEEEVSQLTVEQFSPAPKSRDPANRDFIVAAARLPGGVKTLLDLDRLIAAVASEEIGSPAALAA